MSLAEIINKGLECPECGENAQSYEQPSEFEKMMLLSGKEVEWRKHSKDTVIGCSHCATGWKKENKDEQ
jgi:DNA-directed RNA polymerase subunit RPC12/RpoP